MPKNRTQHVLIILAGCAWAALFSACTEDLPAEAVLSADVSVVEVGGTVTLDAGESTFDTMGFSRGRTGDFPAESAGQNQVVRRYHRGSDPSVHPLL